MAKSPTIKGFRVADEEIEPRMILGVEGPPKCAKTHFSFTAPAPIAYLAIERGFNGPIQKFQKKKRILLKEYDFEVPDIRKMKQKDEKKVQQFMDATADRCRKFLNEFTDDFEAAVYSGVATIVADTATELWEIVRLAHFGKILQVKPHHYSAPNYEYRRLLNLMEKSDPNFILIHKLGDLYKNDKRTGEFKMKGYTDTPFTMHATVRMGKDPDDTPPEAFFLEITDSRINPMAEGEHLDYPDNDFAHVASLVFEDTDLEDWE